MGTIIKNALAGHPMAVDALHRSAALQDFAPGDFGSDLIWDASRNGVSLALAPPGAQLARRRLRGVYTSPVINAEFPFTEVLPSWNIVADELRQSYTIHLRVENEQGWSPWFYLGGSGASVHRPSTSKVVKVPGWGRVKIDYLMLEQPALRFQYRVELESSSRSAMSRQPGPPLLKRFFVAYSNGTGDESLWKSRQSAEPPAVNGNAWARILPVPFRSQTAVPNRKIGHEICCPTCVAMVLESHGINLSTLTVAGHAWCEERRIYGIWPKAAQTAARHGMEAWVQRFRRPDDVKRLIAAGVPVMASIRVKEGELPSARYPKTAGHLILIRGFTPEGAFVVNDPYSPGASGAEIVYSEEEMAKVWFEKGGVGIVIRPSINGESAQ